MQILEKTRKNSFTLKALLVTTSFLVVLFVITLVLVNPARQFKQANNTQRRSDVNAILNAVHQYAADNNGVLPSNISETATNIGSEPIDSDICSDLVTTYIAEMPVDPTEGSWTDCDDYDTGYTVVKSASDDRVTVAAPNAELEETISVTR